MQVVGVAFSPGVQDLRAWSPRIRVYFVAVGVLAFSRVASCSNLSQHVQKKPYFQCINASSNRSCSPVHPEAFSSVLVFHRAGLASKGCGNSRLLMYNHRSMNAFTQVRYLGQAMKLLRKL